MMFKLYTASLQLAPDVKLRELARLSEGFSGSDIRDLNQSAQLELIGEFFESGKASDRRTKPRPLTWRFQADTLRKKNPVYPLTCWRFTDRWF